MIAPQIAAETNVTRRLALYAPITIQMSVSESPSLIMLDHTNLAVDASDPILK